MPLLVIDNLKISYDVKKVTIKNLRKSDYKTLKY
jgi:hypothetical protein